MTASRDRSGGAARSQRMCAETLQKRAFLHAVCQEARGSHLASGRVVVDCWIGVTQEKNRRVVRLAGRLSIAQVPELLETCAGRGRVQLDLTDLVSADMAGIEALQRIRAGGATLIGVPGYIQLKLDSQGPSPALPAKGRRGTK